LYGVHQFYDLLFVTVYAQTNWTATNGKQVWLITFTLLLHIFRISLVVNVVAGNPQTLSVLKTK